MSPFWLRILGIDPSRIPDDAQTQFVWTRAPQSWGVFVLLAVVAVAVYGVFALYRREIASCPPAVRRGLAVLRAAVLVMLAVVYLGPALAITQQTTVEPTVVLLLDESQSMTVPDHYRDDQAAAHAAAATGRDVATVRLDRPQRVALMNRLLAADDAKWVRDLAERGRLRVYSFSDDVELRQTWPMTKPADDTQPGAADENAAANPAVDAPPEPLELAATGQGTHLAKALRQTLRGLGGSPVAGVVLVTDGRDTAVGDDPLDAADFAADQGAALFTLGVGDPARPRNIQVASVFADRSVWRADPFELRAIIATQGFEGESIQVELIEQPADADPSADPATAQGKVIETKTVTPAPVGETGAASGAGQAEVTFTHTPVLTGKFIYMVRVPPRPDEQFESDNVGRAPVTVLNDRARVLLIAGGPSWDFRFVQGVLSRDKTINLSCWQQALDVDMLQEGDTPIKKLPTSPTELFEYDAVLLFDPDPREFDEAWAQWLETFLSKHGGGLLYQAGPQHSATYLTAFRTRGLRKLLPVRFGDLGAMEVRSLLTTNAKQWPFQVVNANLDHPMMRFTPDPPFNLARWQRMPGVYWSFPTEAAKPATQVLLEHGNPAVRSRDGRRPLIVTGQYGPGRTAYLAFNSTWRWRSVGKDTEFFTRFWVQTVRHLVQGRLLKGKGRGSIKLPGQAARVGEPIKIEASLFDADYQPWEQPKAEAIVTRQGSGQSTPVELSPVPGKPGQYEGVVIPAQPGLTEIAVTLPAEGATPMSRISRQVEVRLPDAEFDDTRLNKPLLVELADRTGGQYFEIDQAGDIPAAIPDRTQTIVVAGRPAELWDTDRLLILLVTLLALEWALRKRYKLL